MFTKPELIDLQLFLEDVISWHKQKEESHLKYIERAEELKKRIEEELHERYE
jgi:hypothetical protein